MIRCYIALGSNLMGPLAQVRQAVTAIKKLPDSVFISTSPWYQTKAIGPGDQPDYINGVVSLDTKLTPLKLLHLLQQIEDNQQRVRKEHWGSRTLDLDILLYGEQIINEPALLVPHPRMKERSFVLYPLFDIAPQLQFPDGSSLHALLHYQCNDDIRRLDEHHDNELA